MIIVAVKQSESPSPGLKDSPDVERIRNLEDDYDLMIDTNDTSTEEEETTTIMPLPSTASSQSITTTTEESYHSKLERLMGLILLCKKLMPSNEKCDVNMTSVNEENVDDHSKGLNDEIMNHQIHSNMENLVNISSVLKNMVKEKTISQTSYSSVIAALGPLIQEQENPTPRLILSADQGNRSDVDVDEHFEYNPVEEVFCDPHRERRCRDKKKCYPIAQHCDFILDCDDNSDEDECSCVDRLVDDRLCDGYIDCDGGEDEANCGCSEN